MRVAGQVLYGKKKRMKRFAILIISIFLIIGCKIDPIWEFDEIPDLGLASVQDVMSWVAGEIEYVSDDIHYPADEYWQSPAQTYIWRCGDCEDYAILALYLVHRDVGIDGQMWCSEDHGWVYVDGHQWEPQLAVICDGWYNVVVKLDYREVMRRATTTHKSLE
jgi:hypothetical protein